MNDFALFAQRTSTRAKQVSENADKAVKTMALAIHSGEILATPIDEGVAKSNWIATLNDPVDFTIPAYVPGKKGSTVLENIDAAIAQGSAVISQYQAGDTIHIANALPYIQRLNDGYSVQAGEQFVEQTIQEIVPVVMNTVKLINDI